MSQSFVSESNEFEGASCIASNNTRPESPLLTCNALNDSYENILADNSIFQSLFTQRGEFIKSGYIDA